MKPSIFKNYSYYSCFLFLLFSQFALNKSLAQCSALSGPSYSNTCSTDYFTAITASGTGVISSISYPYTSCVSTYFNYFSTQGVSASSGTLVSVVVNRCLSTYTAYTSIWVDWNNDNIYQTTEEVSGPYTYVGGATTHTFSFTVPSTGVIYGTHLHMRVYLGEGGTAPCTATYGETADYYFQVNCSSFPTIVTSPSSGSFCVGSSGIYLTASGAGTGGTYTWTPAAGLSATTGGSVTATPTVTTIYTVTGTTSGGCPGITTVPVTVNPSPAAITGSMGVCESGGTTTLSDATAGGTWSTSSSNISLGTSGIVTGVTSGTAVVTYTAGGCYVTATVTVNPLPVISGSLSLCSGSTTSLTSSISGVTWTSSNASVATVGVSTGIVTGITAASCNITCFTTSTGCYATATITVNPNPAAITGVLSVCPGGTTTLSDATTGGTWSTSSSNITIGSVSGTVTGVAAGSAAVTYTSGLGCNSFATVTVNSLPASVSGSLNVCIGTTTTLTDATGGGTWSCSNSNIVVGSASGVVTGVALGTSVITYTASTGCFITAVETVNAFPSSISGTPNLCIGIAATFTDATTGGVWSASNSNVITGSSSGIITGVSSGTSVISYTTGSGCYVTYPVTINPVPASISGLPEICVGSTSFLFETTSGGYWSSSNGNVTIGSTSGFITGVSAGSSVLSYTLGTGCYSVFLITADPLPASISGPLNVCVGQTVTLIDGTSGGTWSISNSNATIGSSSGIVSGVTTGTSIVTYTLSTGCSITAVVTINGLPASISGAASVCVGSSTLFSDISTGGTWSVSNSNATIGSSSGTVSGISSGTSVITYTLSTGCYITSIITVNPLPLVISGTLQVCPGATTTLTDASGGGLWSSSNTNATIGSGSGIAAGITAGTTIITYIIPTGCLITAVLTINPVPASISGPSQVCIGSGISLTDASGGGIWSISNTNASIGSLTGIVTGAAAGTSVITYTLPTGCYITALVSVNPLPSVIFGTMNVCVGSADLLGDITSGGTWSISNSHASIGSGTGLVTGITSGTAVVTYTSSVGCIATASFTVNSLPALISGTLNVCTGLTTVVTDATGGGTWSVSNTNATIGSTSGLVTGNTAGTSIITYTLATGCFNTAVLTINPLPATITGPLQVCVDGTINLYDATSGGIWSSSNTNAATGSLSGIISGVSSGISVITYALSTGCIADVTITVNPLPSLISGIMDVCPGLTVTLSDGFPGGDWTSSNSNATIGSVSGIVTGVSSGTAVITYTLPTGCYSTSAFTVNLAPDPISGVTVVCVGSTSGLTDGVSGGTWTISNSNADIDPFSGIVSGITSGTASVTYSLSDGCLSTTEITIDALPSPISGGPDVCIGSSLPLTDPGGGLWSSSNTNVTVGSISGIITGAALGTSVVTYTVGTGCTVTETITVHPLPLPVSGPEAFCTGSAVTLSDPSPGGVWSSGSTNISVGTFSGLINGLSAGISTVTYTISTGCYVTFPVIVNPVPSAISGSSSVCPGATITLADVTSGGSWSSSNGNVTIGTSSGILTGLASGTSVVTYLLTTGCYVTKSITVNPLPAVISGANYVCAGSTAILSDAGGGVWTSSNPLVASVGSSSGLVAGISAGTVNITYTLPTGCMTIHNMTVNPLPSPVSGSTSVCLGVSSPLTDAGGGTWTSSLPGVASIGSLTGMVYGSSIGASVITYTISTGCYVTTTVNIISLPPAITGANSVCQGSTTAFTDAGGGVWSASNTNISVGTSTGIVTGITAGKSIVTYTLGTGCSVTHPITVNPSPGTISGITGLCIGSTATLSDGISGGSWSSSNPLIVSVGSSSGFITGLSVGTSIISYSLGIGCDAVVAVTVNSFPAAISGPSAICQGSGMTYTDPGSGVWTSSNISLATIGSATGILIGLLPGNDTITYTSGSGCSVKKFITINPLPASISGTGTICIGSSSPFTNSSPGGTWSVSNPVIASIGSASGIVNGLNAGTLNISYTLSTGCSINKPVTISPLPPTITGTFIFCQGVTSILSDAVTGGIWTSSNAAVAAAGSGSGSVTGVSAGSALITYIIGTGCLRTVSVTINPLPAAVSGNFGICIGSASLLTDSSPGGTWSSSNSTIAPIGSASGLVNGITLGTANITYTIPTGCFITQQITIDPLPTVISGSTTVCMGASLSLSDAITGGTWSSANPSVAAAGSSSGYITGIAVGSAIITYTLSVGCFATVSFTVKPSPSPVLGATSVCAGSAITLTDITAGGVWSSGSPSIATVGSSSGIVNGMSSGTAIVSYTSTTTGCSAILPIIVNPINPVTGPASVCAGYTAVMTDSVPGGIWSSSNPAIGSVNSAGVVTGLTPGSTTIVYVLPTGCSATYPVTVNAIPPVITGASHLCVGQNITLSDALPGGVWISGNPSVGSVDPYSGMLEGVSAGVVTLSYTFLGCPRTFTVTVNALPGAISGSLSICQGTSTTLSSSGTGGIWTSSNPSIAGIGSSSGVANALLAGTSSITYTLSTGCTVNTILTVMALPAAVGGPVNLCMGSIIALTDATPSGLWSSSNVSVAPVGTFTGTVIGLAAGVATITYTIPTGCIITQNVTVNTLPLSITGISQLCVGTNSVLADATPGGIWSSYLPGVAAVGSSTGIVTGYSSGTDTIYYLIPATGCYTSAVITINPLPSAILGASNLCTGFTTTFTDSSPSGTWSTSDSGIATIGSGSGIITGISAGTVTISYTLAGGCIAARLLTVYPVPSVISGSVQVCLDGTSSLYDAVPGGHWYSASTSIATIDSISGTVTGVSIGTDIISYSFNAACSTSITITVNPLPYIYNLTGGGNYCAGGSGVHVGLSGSSVGVDYMLYRGITATGSFPGTGTAMDFGLQTIVGMYSVIATTTATGCSNNMAGSAMINTTPLVIPAITFNAYPADTVCSGTTVTYSPLPVNGGTSPAYQWSVNGTSVATTSSYTYIPANGDVVMATLTSNASCALPLTASYSVTAVVNPFGTPSVNLLASPGTTVCRGSLVTLSPVPHLGGSSPVFSWIINGVNMGSSSSYSYVPVNDDHAYCIMESNYLCRLNNLDTSAIMILTTDTPVVPQVSISASPSALISSGQHITLTASVINGGFSPTYQWVVNSIPVSGATNSSYSRDSFAAPFDSVTCLVTNHDLCNSTGFQWIFINVAPAEVNIMPSLADLAVLPNPSSGDFILKGSVGTKADATVTIVITDLPGREIFKHIVKAQNGLINERIELGPDNYSGFYLMKVNTTGDQKVFHLVIEK